MTDYSAFTALLPALVGQLSQALRDKQYPAARSILNDIAHKLEGVETWLNIKERGNGE